MITYYLPKPLHILFIGINPHTGSYRRGVPFSNNKTFWYLLQKAGLLQESMEKLRNDTHLLEIYSNKFGPVYHYGLLNVVDRPSNNVTALRAGEEREGVQRIKNAIEEYQPSIVCFISKIAYQKFINEGTCTYGWQESIGNSKIYVMHFPLRGAASIRIEELKEVQDALNGLLTVT